MGYKKRVHSFWPTTVRPLSISANQFRIIDGRKVTPAVLKKYGSRLIILDEGTKALEHCGADITDAQLVNARPREDMTEQAAPAAKTLYGSSTSKKTTPKVEEKAAEVKPEPKPVVEEVVEEVVETVEVAPEPEVAVAEEAPAVEEAPAPTKKRRGRKAAPQKSADPVVEPEVDADPFE